MRMQFYQVAPAATVKSMEIGAARLGVATAALLVVVERIL